VRVGDIRTFGSFPVMLSAPGTKARVQFSGPQKVYSETTYDENVYTSWWQLITVYPQVQSILDSVNLTGKDYLPYQMLMVAYDQSQIAFYGLYGSKSAPPAGQLNAFPAPQNGVAGVQGVLDPCEPFQGLYVRSDIPWWGQSGSLLSY
jgi:hypothetical protein